MQKKLSFKMLLAVGLMVGTGPGLMGMESQENNNNDDEFTAETNTTSSTTAEKNKVSQKKKETSSPDQKRILEQKKTLELIEDQQKIEEEQTNLIDFEKSPEEQATPTTVTTATNNNAEPDIEQNQPSTQEQAAATTKEEQEAQERTTLLLKKYAHMVNSDETAASSIEGQEDFLPIITNLEDINGLKYLSEESEAATKILHASHMNEVKRAIDEINLVFKEGELIEGVSWPLSDDACGWYEGYVKLMQDHKSQVPQEVQALIAAVDNEFDRKKNVHREGVQLAEIVKQSTLQFQNAEKALRELKAKRPAEDINEFEKQKATEVVAANEKEQKRLELLSLQMDGIMNKQASKSKPENLRQVAAEGANLWKELLKEQLEATEAKNKAKYSLEVVEKRLKLKDAELAKEKEISAKATEVGRAKSEKMISTLAQEKHDLKEAADQLKNDVAAAERDVRDKQREIKSLEAEVLALSINSVTKKDYDQLRTNMQALIDTEKAEVTTKVSDLQAEEAKLVAAQSWMGTFKNNKTQLYMGVTGATVSGFWMLDKFHVSKNGGWKEFGKNSWSNTQAGGKYLYAATLGRLMGNGKKACKNSKSKNR